MISIRGTIIGVALALGAGLSWWLSAQLRSTVRPAATPRQHVVDYYTVDFTTTAMSDKGKPLHRLRAQRLVHYMDDDTSTLIQPRIQIFEDKTPPWHIRSDLGWISSQGKTVKLKGNVQMRRKAGPHTRAIHAHTTWLLIRPDNNFATTDRPITATSPGFEVKSVGMNINLDQGRLQLLSQVFSTYDETQKRSR